MSKTSKRSSCTWCPYEGRSDNVHAHMRTCKQRKIERELAKEKEYDDLSAKYEEMKEAYDDLLKEKADDDLVKDNERMIQEIQEYEAENERMIQKIREYEADFHAKKEEESSKEGIVYILKTRESIRMNEDVYKIGRTKNMKNRLSQYPKGSEFIAIMKVNDQRMCERVLLYAFKDKFKQRQDMGNEYFEGNLDEMKCVLCDIARLFA